MRALAKQQEIKKAVLVSDSVKRTQSAHQSDGIQPSATTSHTKGTLLTGSASLLSKVAWRPSAPACLLSGVIVASLGTGFVLGTLRADASDDSIRIVEASFQSGSGRVAGNILRRDGLPSAAAALPDRAFIEGGLSDLQSHLRDQLANADLGAEVLVPAIGRMKSEILELRVLFKRLADVAELYDGEFDLDFEAVDDPTIDLPQAEQAEDASSALPDEGDDMSLLEQLSVHDTVQALTLSIAQLDHISEQTERMKSIFLDRSSAHDRRITAWPLRGGRVTSRFGHRVHPISGIRQLHRGMDFSAIVGTPILAMADGIVAFSGPNGSYGNLVELEHGDGYRTRYAHNESNLVEAGQRVLKGQQIATLGTTGRSTGPHVHVEVRREGAPLDPATFLR